MAAGWGWQRRTGAQCRNRGKGRFFKGISKFWWEKEKEEVWAGDVTRVAEAEKRRETPGCSLFRHSCHHTFTLCVATFFSSKLSVVGTFSPLLPLPFPVKLGEKGTHEKLGPAGAMSTHPGEQKHVRGKVPTGASPEEEDERKGETEFFFSLDTSTLLFSSRKMGACFEFDGLTMDVSRFSFSPPPPPPSLSLSEERWLLAPPLPLSGCRDSICLFLALPHPPMVE